MHIEATIGMATGPMPGETIEQLIARADTDMYTVKAARHLADSSAAGKPTKVV